MPHIKIRRSRDFKVEILIPWASCQIHVRTNAGCACAWNAGNVFPATLGHRSRHALRNVRDARAMMHAAIVNWRFPLMSVAGKTFPGIPGACATRNFTYLVRGLWKTIYILRRGTDAMFHEILWSFVIYSNRITGFLPSLLSPCNYESHTNVETS